MLIAGERLGIWKLGLCVGLNFKLNALSEREFF